MSETISVDIVKVRCKKCGKILISSHMKSFIIDCGCENYTLISKKMSVDNEYLIGGMNLDFVERFDMDECKYVGVKDGENWENFSSVIIDNNKKKHRK